MSKIIESLETRLSNFATKLSNFAKFLEVVRGKENVQTRPDVVLNPKNKLTSSNITAEQADFVSSAYFMAYWFPEGQPLRVYAEIYLQVSASKNGWGIDKIIEHEQALGEKSMMRLGLRPGQQQEQGKKALEKDVK